MQQTLLDRALQFRDTHTQEIDEYADFERFFTPENKKQPEAHGGFAYSHWCGGAACEEKINKALAVTIQSITPAQAPFTELLQKALNPLFQKWILAQLKDKLMS